MLQITFLSSLLVSCSALLILALLGVYTNHVFNFMFIFENISFYPKSLNMKIKQLLFSILTILCTQLKTKERGNDNDAISIVKHKILNKKQCDLSRFVCHLSVAIL